ncbi:MAG: ATP-dependent DNA helicase RecG, partial [Oscillospiraceae bacterium]|nr:ATP-dependent DNA helicase RecG [Oscillospiraceae bacterium]
LYAEDCFKNLAFIVTDEQHRFGVQQRAEIIGKGRNPHMLVMSATPIPRTMALFVYGNLDVSVIDEMPANRHPVETYVVTPDYRSRIYKFILKHISAKKQAYIVCPLIEKSENTPDTLSDAENYIKELKSGILRDARISLLHSRIPAAQKDEIMYAFADGEIDVLVSTTVVEVGVDVPNATLMIVENAERFGLSQLHQLRGRVGRGKDKSYCILISRNKNSERLKIMARCSDGFVIAKEDLKLRGIGDFFGNRQHGMPFFQLVSVYDDIEVIRETRRSAENILTGDPMLEKEENAPLKKLIKNLISEDAAGRLN